MGNDLVLLCTGVQSCFVFGALAFDNIIFVKIQIQNLSDLEEILGHKIAGNNVCSCKIFWRVGNGVDKRFKVPAQSLVKLARKNNADIGSEIGRLLSLEPVKTACVAGVKEIRRLGDKLISVLAVSLFLPRKNMRTVDAVCVFFTVVNHYKTLSGASHITHCDLAESVL